MANGCGDQWKPVSWLRAHFRRTHIQHVTTPDPINGNDLSRLTDDGCPLGPACLSNQDERFDSPSVSPALPTSRWQLLRDEIELQARVAGGLRTNGPKINRCQLMGHFGNRIVRAAWIHLASRFGPRHHCCGACGQPLRRLIMEDLTPEAVRSYRMAGTLDGILGGAYMCKTCMKPGKWVLIE